MLTEFQRRGGIWVILVSFLLAGFLAIVPLPDWVEVFRPEWMALVVIYWVMALPHRIGLIAAWVAGLFVDILEGALLGSNALALAVVAYFVLSLYQRLRMFSPVQLSVTVLILIAVHQLLSFWVMVTTSQNTSTVLPFLMSSFSSALIWPFVFVSLRYCWGYFQGGLERH